MNEAHERWHQRWHPLWREWIVYAAHRNSRPWQGQEETPTAPAPAYDPHCYLCPGNQRVHGDRNPNYTDVFVFDNDHPVVGANAPQADCLEGVYQRRSATGCARVVCYDPRHNVSLAEMTTTRVTKVFLAWQAQVRELRRHPDVRSILIFENKGAVVGVSNPHPHCQIYGANFVFTLVERELTSAAQRRSETGRNIFREVIDAELNDGVRIVAENDAAVAFLPYFARYAYEVWMFPKQRHATLDSLSTEELADLSEVFQEVIRRYDLNYDQSFPYVLSVLQAPVDGGVYDDYHLHLVLQPPLRQPGIKKFPAGPEIGGGNFMADTLPEEMAAKLRAVDLSSYKESL